MGALSDFLRGAAGEVYNQRAQKRQMESQLEMEAAREKRQLKFAEAAEARRRRQTNEDRATELNLRGPAVDVDDTGQAALMRAVAEVDPESGALRARRERVADAPVTIERRGTRKTAEGTVTGAWMTDGTFVPDGDPMPPRPVGGSVPRDADGLTPYQRAQLEETRKNRERLERNNSKGGERPDNVRKAWDEEATRISAMEGEALRSKAIQYGMDQRGLPTDDDTLRSALLAQVESEYGKRLKSASSRGPEPPAPPSNIPAAAVAELKRDPSPEAIKEFDDVFGPGAAKWAMGGR